MTNELLSISHMFEIDKKVTVPSKFPSVHLALKNTKQEITFSQRAAEWEISHLSVASFHALPLQRTCLVVRHEF